MPEFIGIGLCKKESLLLFRGFSLLLVIGLELIALSAMVILTSTHLWPPPINDLIVIGHVIIGIIDSFVLG